MCLFPPLIPLTAYGGFLVAIAFVMEEMDVAYRLKSYTKTRQIFILSTHTPIFCQIYTPMISIISDIISDSVVNTDGR